MTSPSHYQDCKTRTNVCHVQRVSTVKRELLNLQWSALLVSTVTEALPMLVLRFRYFLGIINHDKAHRHKIVSVLFHKIKVLLIICPSSGYPQELPCRTILSGAVRNSQAMSGGHIPHWWAGTRARRLYAVYSWPVSSFYLGLTLILRISTFS